MAAFTCQDVHQAAAFIPECLLARMVGVDRVDFNGFPVSSESESECFVSAGSAGSLADSNSNAEFASCSSATSDDMSTFWLVIPMSLLLTPSGCPFDGLFV
jgi:hypothetical protein